MTDVLEVSGLTKRYGTFLAVNNLSYTVRPGTICGFLGPNGAGKTSTLRMILGMSTPSDGHVKVLGHTGARQVQDRIGFLPEERGLYRKMTALEAICFFGELKGLSGPEARRRALFRLEQQGLGASAHKAMKDLSKGMAQKVQLITAILHDPEFLILDEPFSGLDPMNQQGLEDIIREMAGKGTTILFSTHIMQHAERLCDKVVLIAKGTKQFDGTVPEALAKAPRTITLDAADNGTPLSTDQLSNLPGVGAVHQQPGLQRWDLTLLPGVAAAAPLRAAFAADLAIGHFQTREPSLHDAFLVLTQQGEARA